MKLPQRSDFPPELIRVATWRTLLAIALDWLAIAASIAVASRWPIAYLPAVVLIASRQHALFCFMHEGTHFLISKNRTWNDRLSNWLAAWPVGFSTERYRIRHWIHHRYVNSDKDPDWARKKDDPTWQFPMSPAKAWTDSLAHLLGKGVIEMTYALRGIGITRDDWPVALPYFAVLGVIITVCGAWKGFALFWLAPYYTVLPFFHRVRNASEHLALPKTHSLDGTRNVVGSPFECFLFGPHNANLHGVHHIFPFIPWHRLPEARAFLLQNEEFRLHVYENDSYFLPTRRSVFRDWTTPITAEKKKEAA